MNLLVFMEIQHRVRLVTHCIDDDGLVGLKVMGIFEFEIEVRKLGNMAFAQVDITGYES